jgi:AcrR family transcriptional regulator
LKRKGAGYHHGDLRRALVEATIKLVDARGAEEFTLRAAAKLAGVSDGAPYHHFADKDSLLAAAAESGFVSLGEEMTAAGANETDPTDQCIQMGVAYVLFAARHPAWFRLMFGTLALQRKKHPDLARAAAHASGLVKQSMAITFGDPSSRRSEGRWFGSWAMVHGLSLLAIDGHLGSTGKDPKKLEKLAHAAIVAFANPEKAADSVAPASARMPRSQAAPRVQTRSSRPPPPSEPPVSVQRPKTRAVRERNTRTAGTRR